MRVVAAMIVGPGETLRYLDRTLRLAQEWADLMVVVDDGADLDTRKAIETADVIRRRESTRFHEGDARNALARVLDEILDPADFVMVIDADEELRTLDGGDPFTTIHKLAHSTDPGPFGFTHWHLWNPEGTVHRVDGGWRSPCGYRAYRHQPGLLHVDRELAVPAVPGPAQSGTGGPVMAVKHWGYARPHDRARKHAWYMEHDGGRFHHVAHLQSIVTDPILEPVPCS